MAAVLIAQIKMVVPVVPVAAVVLQMLVALKAARPEQEHLAKATMAAQVMLVLHTAVVVVAVLLGLEPQELLLIQMEVLELHLQFLAHQPTMLVVVVEEVIVE